MVLSQEERQRFANKIKIQLEQCNYGFQVEEESYGEGFSFQEARNMRAIKELMIRLNVWIIKGKKDSGSISYSEAQRKIEYILDEDNINKCKVNLLKFRK